MSIIIPPFQALNFDPKVDGKCCGNSTFCQIYETNDTPCVQVQLTRGTDLICQGEFANFLTDGDNGTFESGNLDNFSAPAMSGALDGISVVSPVSPHTGTKSVEGDLTGLAGTCLKHSTAITLEAGKEYWLKTWIWLDGWNIAGGDNVVFSLGINTGWATATTTIIKQVDDTNGIQDTWLELITKIVVTTTSTGTLKLVVAGSDIADYEDAHMYFDDFGVTCWEIIDKPYPLGFTHDWINEELDFYVARDAFSADNAVVQQEVDIIPCTWYKLNYNIKRSSLGEFYLIFTLGGNVFTKNLTASDSLDYDGFIYLMAGDLDSLLKIEVGTAVVPSVITGSIDNITLEEFSMPAYCLENCKTGEKICSTYQCDGVYAYAGNDITIYEDEDGNFWALICPDLTGLDGCYKICLYDTLESFYGIELICNGGFNDSICWNVIAYVTISGGLLHFNVPAGQSYAWQQDGQVGVDFKLHGGCKYTLEFDIVNWVKGQLLIYIEDSFGILPLIFFSDSGDGHYIHEIDLTGITGDYNRIRFLNVLPNLIGMQMDIDNVSVIAKEYCGEEATPIACTDCLCIKETWDCSILLQWTNEENAFGFEYEISGFVQSLRINGDLFYPKYSKDKETFRFSDGRRNILFSDTTKVERLTIADMPEYLHDSLAIGVEHDEFYIDSEKYIVEEDSYAPDWRKTAVLAPVKIEVIKDNQNLKNNNC